MPLFRVSQRYMRERERDRERERERERNLTAHRMGGGQALRRFLRVIHVLQSTQCDPLKAMRGLLFCSKFHLGRGACMAGSNNGLVVINVSPSTPESWRRLPKVNSLCTAVVFNSQHHPSHRRCPHKRFEDDAPLSALCHGLAATPAAPGACMAVVLVVIRLSLFPFSKKGIPVLLVSDERLSRGRYPRGSGYGTEGLNKLFGYTLDKMPTPAEVKP